MKKSFLNFISTIPGWLSVHEGEFLLKSGLLIKSKKGVIVEIGSFQGKSTIWLALSKQKVFAIDPHKGELAETAKVPRTLEAFKENIKSAGVSQYVIPIVSTSQVASKTWNKKIKLLFIDGLHDYKNALLDYTLWSDYLTENGIIAMHDSFCGWTGAGEVALEKIINNNEYYEVGVVGSIIYGIKGKSGLLSKINRFRCRVLISLAFKINELPKIYSFFIIHRVIKLFLLNRYTLRRD